MGARNSLAVGCLVAVTAGSVLLFRYWTAEPAPHYVTAPASRGTVAPSVSASGTVNPQTTVQVGTYASGVIQSVACDFNTTVRSGQLCAKIDPRPYQSFVDQAEAGLAIATAQRQKDVATSAYTKLVRERDEVLIRRHDVSQATLDLATGVDDQARAQITLDDATIRQQVAALGSAKVNLGYTDIVSPVNGTVVSRNVSAGQTVAASFQTPTLFVIATDLTRMQVDTYVSESDIDSIKPGSKVLFTVSALPTTPFLGIVTQIRNAPQMVQNVVTYDVVVSVDNRLLALKPGMTAVAHIVTAEHDNVLRVPSAALRFTPDGPGATAGAARSQVWVLRYGRPVAVPVVAGLDDDIATEIVWGDVKPQDEIIVAEQSQAGRAAGSQ